MVMVQSTIGFESAPGVRIVAGTASQPGNARSDRPGRRAGSAKESRPPPGKAVLALKRMMIQKDLNQREL
jgi:hypothetical protein